MNSRLELPSVVDGRRQSIHPSRTSGSLTSVPLPLKPPVGVQARTPPGSRVEEAPSPEEYFANYDPFKSKATTLDTANLGKALLQHKLLESTQGPTGAWNY